MSRVSSETTCAFFVKITSGLNKKYPLTCHLYIIPAPFCPCVKLIKSNNVAYVMKQNEWCFRPRFCTVRLYWARGQPWLMRWILCWNMPLVQDRSLHLLTSNPARYQYATDAPGPPRLPEYIINLKVLKQTLCMSKIYTWDEILRVHVDQQEIPRLLACSVDYGFRTKVHRRGETQQNTFSADWSGSFMRNNVKGIWGTFLLPGNIAVLDERQESP